MAERRKKLPRGRPLHWARLPAEAQIARSVSRTGRVAERWQHYGGAQLERVEWFVPSYVWLDGRRLLRRGAWYLYWRPDALVPIATLYTTGHGGRLAADHVATADLNRKIRRWAAGALDREAARLGEVVPSPADFSVFMQSDWPKFPRHVHNSEGGNNNQSDFLRSGRAERSQTVVQQQFGIVA